MSWRAVPGERASEREQWLAAVLHDAQHRGDSSSARSSIRPHPPPPSPPRGVVSGCALFGREGQEFSRGGGQRGRLGGGQERGAPGEKPKWTRPASVERSPALIRRPPDPVGAR